MNSPLNNSPFPPLRPNIRYRTAMERAGFDVAYLRRQERFHLEEEQLNLNITTSELNETSEGRVGLGLTSKPTTDLSSKKYIPYTTRNQNSDSAVLPSATILTPADANGHQKNQIEREFSDVKNDLIFKFDSSAKPNILSEPLGELEGSNTSSRYNTPHVGEPTSKFNGMDPVEQSFMRLTNNTGQSADPHVDMEDMLMREDTAFSQGNLSNFSNNSKSDSNFGSKSNLVSVSLEPSASLNDAINETYSTDSHSLLTVLKSKDAETKKSSEQDSLASGNKESSRSDELKTVQEIQQSRFCSPVKQLNSPESEDVPATNDSFSGGELSTSPLELSPRSPISYDINSMLAVSGPLKYMENMDSRENTRLEVKISSQQSKRVDSFSEEFSVPTGLEDLALKDTLRQLEKKDNDAHKDPNNASVIYAPPPVIEVSDETNNQKSGKENTTAVEKLLAELDTVSLTRDTDYSDNLKSQGLNPNFGNGRTKKSSAYLSRYEPQSISIPSISHSEESTLISLQSNSTPTFYKFTENTSNGSNIQGDSPLSCRYSPCNPPLKSPRSSTEESSRSESPKQSIKYPAGKGPCRACGLEITGKGVYSKRANELSGQWHRGCFRCVECGKKFSKKVPCYILNDQPYCQQHFHIKNNSICKVCGGFIEGECRENDKNERFHVNCLKCAICDEAIQQDYYVFNKDVHICNRHDVTGLSVSDFSSSSDTNNSKNTISKRRTRLINFY